MDFHFSVVLIGKIWPKMFNARKLVKHVILDSYSTALKKCHHLLGSYSMLGILLVLFCLILT